MFECKNLTAVAEGVLGQHAQFGKRVNDHPFRIQFLDLRDDCLRRISKLNFRGMKDGVLPLGLEMFFIRQ